MASLERKRVALHRYTVCPHCGKELSHKKFKEHERLYYCIDAKKWYTEDLMDNDHSSDFSSIEEVSNRGDTPESDNLFDDTIDDDPLPTYRCTEIVDSDKGIIILTRTIIIINYYVFSNRTLD